VHSVLCCVPGPEFNEQHVAGTVRPTQARPDGRKLQFEGEACQSREVSPGLGRTAWTCTGLFHVKQGQML